MELKDENNLLPRCDEIYYYVRDFMEKYKGKTVTVVGDDVSCEGYIIMYFRHGKKLVAVFMV
jgi:hypothetical protein